MKVSKVQKKILEDTQRRQIRAFKKRTREKKTVHSNRALPVENLGKSLIVSKGVQPK